MAKPVIGGALLPVFQRVVGLVDFLELVLGLGIAGVAVRVELHGEFAIGAFQGRLVGALLAAEHFVKIAFGQKSSPKQPVAHGIAPRLGSVVPSLDGNRPHNPQGAWGRQDVGPCWKCFSKSAQTGQLC